MKIRIEDHVKFDGAKMAKLALATTARAQLDLYCVAPGQYQKPHTHADQDKFYFVVEGQGDFTVGPEARQAGPGVTVWAPAGAPHGVANHGSARLVLLVGIAPWK